jgi:Carboxypeptidase regulatory-like domain
MRTKTKPFLLGFSLLAVPIPFTVSRAQNVNAQAGSIAGTTFLIDQSGNKSFIPDASVVLRGPVSATTKSDEEGRYSFHLLPGGTYTITAKLPGLAAVKTVSVKAGETSDVPIQLKLIEADSAIHVTVSGSNTDVTQPLTLSISESALRNLQVNPLVDSSRKMALESSL